MDGNRLRKTMLPLTTLAVAMIILVSISCSFNVATANPDYDIEHVDHMVTVLYNGYIVINDTIRTSGQVSGSLSLGLPHKYGAELLRCFAYDTSDKSSTYQVTLDVPLEDRPGFYGIKIGFPQGAPEVFSVEYVLSNVLLDQDVEDPSQFTLDFPAFPSLTKTVAVCNGSILFPDAASYVSGTIPAFDYDAENLTAFTYDTSTVTFTIGSEKIQIFDIDQLNRAITINELGQLTCSDSYYITNSMSRTMSSIEIILPANASNPVAEDQFGRTMNPPVVTNLTELMYRIDFTSEVEANRSARFAVNYDLPKEVYIRPGDTANRFDFIATLFQELNYYVKQASVSFSLPEGAKLLYVENFAVDGLYSIGRNVFQETVAIDKEGLLSLNSFPVEISYEYNPLWLAFRPTMWVWALCVAGCSIVFVWRRPRVPVTVAVPAKGLRIRPEYIESFVDSYQERVRIISEIDSLEAKVQKGRIPRRRYKVQRKTLEMRLNTLARSLADVKEKMRSAGGHYSDLMRQLEVAETEITEAEANIKSIDARHSRGEISLEAYRKLLGDYQRRKEKAQTTTNGILLRLREETR